MLKNTEVDSYEMLDKLGVTYFPDKNTAKESTKTLKYGTHLIPTDDFEFYETRLPDYLKNNENHYIITAPAYKVFTSEQDDCFIDDLINDCQCNQTMANKLNELREFAFTKFPDSDKEALHYLYETLIEDFLTDNKYLRVIY